MNIKTISTYPASVLHELRFILNDSVVDSAILMFDCVIGICSPVFVIRTKLPRNLSSLDEVSVQLPTLPEIVFSPSVSNAAEFSWQLAEISGKV